MKRLITLFMLIVAGCGGDDKVDPFVTLYPFLIDSTPCKGSILVPAENVTIQQGETKGPYYSRDFTYACFIVSTTGPSTISITTAPSSKTDIRFLLPALQQYNSDYEIDPTTNIPVALNSAEVRISSTNKFDFSITVN